MSTITLYTFEDAAGAPDSYSTQDYAEARDRAKRYSLRLIANDYEWADSELLEDYTPGSAVQPNECVTFDGDLICEFCEVAVGDTHDTGCPHRATA